MPAANIVRPRHAGMDEGREPGALVFQKPQTCRIGLIDPAKCLAVPSSVFRVIPDHWRAFGPTVRLQPSDFTGTQWNR